ncbi:MAG: hypothetical protein JW963_08930 [Anaerolineales bacterium]|nr:hypothetical protein [Anaerolineales bacterium]
MAKTSVRINLSLGDGVEAKEGLTPSIVDVVSSCDLTDLATGSGIDRKIATLEPEMWRLDGSYKFLDDTPASEHIGLWTGTITDGSGDFTVPPELTITFDGDYDLVAGITLKFSSNLEVYCTNLDIEFYDVGDSLLDSQNYTPDDYEYFCELPASPIEDVRYVVITFNSTNVPFRRLRLIDLDIDTIAFSGGEVKEASVTEDIDPLSVTLPFNTLEAKVFSGDDDFNIVNPAGIYANLEELQKMDVYENIDNEKEYIGRFFLAEWSSPSKNEMEFSSICGIGVLDRLTYLGGVWVDLPWGLPINSEDLVDEIMTDTGIDYSLDVSLEGIELKGWLPICSVREALQQVCFAIGAYATFSRSNVLNILPFELVKDLDEFDYFLTAAEKGHSSPVDLLPLVTGIEIVSHDFHVSSGASQDEILNETFANGSYRLLLKRTLFGAQTGGTATYNITTFKANYIDFTVTNPGTVIISEGAFLIDDKKPNSYYNPSLPETARENVKKIENAYLIRSEIVGDVIERVYDYYQQRYLQKTRLFVPEVTPGSSTLVDTSISTRKIAGIVEQMVTNLAGGFVSDVKITGNAVTVLGAGKYDDRDFIDKWIGTTAEWSVTVGYMNTQTAVYEGTELTLHFLGTGADIGVLEVINGGTLYIEIDGGAPYEWDTDNDNGWVSEKYSIAGLSYGVHTLRMYGGTTPAGPPPYGPHIDYLEVFE